MQRFMLKSKLHRATVTEANLNYEGSISIDADLMQAADIIAFERVSIYNVSNGERFETYAIEAKAGSGVIGLNGAAARKGEVGDLIIIACYGLLPESELSGFKPDILLIDGNNRIKEKIKK